MIRVLVADDHAIVREGIKRIIDEAADITLAGEAENGWEVQDMIKLNDVDIVLLDISMPGPGFLELMHRLNIADAPYRILVFSVQPEEQYALRSLKAGASGYLTKNHSPEELLIALRHIYRGGRYISQSVGEQLADQLTSPPMEYGLQDQLSNREYQIFCMLGFGIRSTDIAKNLSLSPKTISTYRKRIFDKMHFENQAELIRYAVKNELVE